MKSLLYKKKPVNFAGVATAEAQQVQTTVSRKRLKEESQLPSEEHKKPFHLTNALKMLA